MDTLLLFLYDRLDRFERWFDHRFGWFFTNGMKKRTELRFRSSSPPRDPEHGGLKA